LRNLLYSTVFTIFCLLIALWYGIESGKNLATVMGLVIILALLEISLSFDNAVVNASVLDDMDVRWRRYFLTWGILIAVFGMRLLFPILIVAVTAGLWPGEVFSIALEHPEEYAKHISTSHVEVSAFGGMFLLLVFLSFLFDRNKSVHWFGAIESKLAMMGKLESIEIIIASVVLLIVQSFLPDSSRLDLLIYGISGIILYLTVDSLSTTLSPAATQSMKRTGAVGFLYLELLDASLSFDGVLGAFAITTDVVIITLGLAIGAMFVRNLTVFLVEKGTLITYVYLEHGAHYAIGALATIMLATTIVQIPELITGLTGIFFIGLSLFSSIRYRNANYEHINKRKIQHVNCG